MASMAWLRRVLSRGGQVSKVVASRTTAHTAAGLDLAAPAAKPLPTPHVSLAASNIPGPLVVPILGSIPALMMYPEFHKNQIHRLWQRLTEEYGPVVRLKLPNFNDGVLVLRPEDKQTIIRTTQDNPIRRILGSLKQVRDDTIDDFFRQKGGLLTEQEEEWWRVRRAVQTPMMKTKNVEAYLPSMDQVTQEFSDRIADLQAKHGEMPEDFQLEIYKWALESVCLIALNRRFGCLEPNLAHDTQQVKLIKTVEQLFHALNQCEFGGSLYKLFDTPSYKKLKSLHQDLLSVVVENIRITQEMMKSNTGEQDLSLIEQLLVSPTLTSKDVVTFVLDMIFAGIDTTSHSIAFALYLLAKNPDAQRQLHEELDQVLGADPGPVTPKHLARLQYTKAVIKETFRMFPIAPGFMRELNKDVVLSGYHVPKGASVIMLNDYSSQPDSCFSRASEFLPERWLRGHPLNGVNPYALLPFGSGTRMCIGRRVAEQEMYLFLARVLHRFRVSYAYDDIDAEMHLILKPDQPLRFSFTPR